MPHPEKTRPRRRPNHPDASTSAFTRIDAACRAVVVGKLAARELTGWLCQLGLSEPEFRLLWLLCGSVNLRDSGSPSIDQAALAQQLAVSPAQVSALVERLSAACLIEQQRSSADRRRQFCRIAANGQSLVDRVVQRVAALPAAKEAA